jgi:hypothetical protein
MTQYLRRAIDPGQRYRRWIDPRARTLRLADMLAYLRARGWKELPPDRKGLLAFQEPTGELVDGRPLCQFVPDSEEYDDYPQLIFDLLTGLAEFEHRQASEVIDDILPPAHPCGPNGPPAGRAHEPETTGT